MSSVVDFTTTANIFENGDNGFDVFDNPNDSTIDNIVRISGEGDDFVSMSGGDDTILTGAGDDNILGGAGNDYIDGGEGTDIIDGGAGDDIIIGGKGADVLSGGAGSDLFEFELSDFVDENGDVISVDRILDFERGTDGIIINGVDPSMVTVEEDLIKYDGETIINLGDEVTGGQDPDTFELF